MKVWKEKNKDFERIYVEGIEIIKEINLLSKRQKELGFSDFEYSVLLTLEKKFGKDNSLLKDTKELSNVINQKMYPGALVQKTVIKEVEAEIRRFLRRYIKKYSIKLQDIDQLSKKLMDSLRNIGS